MADPVRKAQALVNVGDEVVGAHLIAALSDEIIRLRSLPVESEEERSRRAEQRLRRRLSAAEKVIAAFGELMTLELEIKRRKD